MSKVRDKVLTFVEELLTKHITDDIATALDNRFPLDQEMKAEAWDGSGRTERKMGHNLRYHMAQAATPALNDLLQKDEELRALLKERIKQILTDAISANSEPAA